MPPRFFSLFLITILSLTAPALAGNPPLPERKHEKLGALEKKVETEKKNQEELKAQATRLEADMKGLKTNLIKATANVQEQERSLQDIETKLDELQKQKQQQEDHLARQRKSLADLLLALERIRRLPPETLVARPDAPLQTAQAATIMGTILPEIEKRAEKLKGELETLSQLKKDLTAQKEEAEKSSQKLKSDTEKMNRLVGDRSKALEATQKKVVAKSVEIANLTREAKDFRDLIKRLEKKNREIDRRTGNEAPSDKGESTKLGDTGPALGTGRLPVSGIIKTRYGETDDIGATSKGIIFSARPGSVVVAPLGGIIRYAGEFRNFGKIALIEHKNKFHSLVAGLGKIDTFVGQRVEAGEPLGRLPSDSGRLYYELRYQGDPVSPSKKFSKLN